MIYIVDKNRLLDKEIPETAPVISLDDLSIQKSDFCIIILPENQEKDFQVPKKISTPIALVVVTNKSVPTPLPEKNDVPFIYAHAHKKDLEDTVLFLVDLYKSTRN